MFLGNADGAANQKTFPPIPKAERTDSFGDVCTARDSAASQITAA
jgi:hypothetical protein